MAPRYTLGLHANHDRSASLLRDGLLVGHLAQERLDRIKHSEFNDLPFESIDAVLADAGIGVRDLAAVGFSFVSCDIETAAPEFKREFCERYGLDDLPFFGVSHHRAHALSVWNTIEMDRALVLVVDGAGDRVGNQLEAETLYLAEGDRIEEVDKRFQDLLEGVAEKPHLCNYGLMPEDYRHKQLSVAQKYEQFTQLVGFGHFEDGKTMGLASHGRPLFAFDSVSAPDLSFSLTMADLLDRVHEFEVRSGLNHREFVYRHRADLAATVQSFVEHLLLSLLTHSRGRYGRSQLCLAGGFFLNCVANHRILERGLFERVHIIPAAGDDGQSIGAAFHADLEVGGLPQRTAVPLPYLGPLYEETSIEAVLCDHRMLYRRLDDKELQRELAAHLAAGRVVGLVRGRCELGPRALCHRSLLADPRHPGMKDHLNANVKFRESFRPYAPVVTAEDQMRIFDLRQESPSMLLACPVREEYRSRLPAITHIDGTARVQAVDAAGEPFVHGLLRRFEELSELPVLLNTSFNLAGEPIVETAADAIRTFLATAIDVLVVENFVILRRDNLQRVAEAAAHQPPFQPQAGEE
jgi:carbamoyltransferase